MTLNLKKCKIKIIYSNLKYYKTFKLVVSLIFYNIYIKKRKSYQIANSRNQFY